MSLFNEINNSSTNNGKESSLVSLIEKRNNTDYGAFADIIGDISDCFGHVHAHDTMDVSFERHADIDDLTKMAFGYANRAVVAGAIIQGAYQIEIYDIAKSIFQILQLTTNHSKEFQIEAAAQAQEFVASYDPRLSADLMGLMVQMIASGFDNSFLGGGIENYDKTISILTQTKNQLAARL